jgi:hypothetical protein
VDLVAQFGAKSGECAATTLPYPFPQDMAIVVPESDQITDQLAIEDAAKDELVCGWPTAGTNVR